MTPTDPDRAADEDLRHTVRTRLDEMDDAWLADPDREPEEVLAVVFPGLPVRRVASAGDRVVAHTVFAPDSIRLVFLGGWTPHESDLARPVGDLARDRRYMVTRAATQDAVVRADLVAHLVEISVSGGGFVEEDATSFRAALVQAWLSTRDDLTAQERTDAMAFAALSDFHDVALPGAGPDART